MQELLAFVPQPVYALLLLFPITDRIEAEDAAGGGPFSLFIPTSPRAMLKVILPLRELGHSSPGHVRTFFPGPRLKYS